MTSAMPDSVTIHVSVTEEQPVSVKIAETDAQVVEVALRGLQGARGEPGPQGPKGDKGDPGTAADLSLYLTKTEADSTYATADALADAADDIADSLALKADKASVASNPIISAAVKTDRLILTSQDGSATTVYKDTVTQAFSTASENRPLLMSVSPSLTAGNVGTVSKSKLIYANPATGDITCGKVNGVDVATLSAPDLSGYYTISEVDALIAEVAINELIEASYDQPIFQSAYLQDIEGEACAWMGKELNAKDSVHDAVMKGAKLKASLFSAYLEFDGSSTFTALQDVSAHIYGAVTMYSTSSGNKSSGSILVNGEAVATYTTPSNAQGSFAYSVAAVDLKAGDVIKFSTPSSAGYPKQYGAFYLPTAGAASFLL